jgi:hypothetical protein
MNSEEKKKYQRKYMREYRPEYYKKNPEKAEEKNNSNREYMRDRYKKNPEKIKASVKKYYLANVEKVKIRQKLYWQELRKKIIDFYSDHTNRCACCGESHFEFLTIDHINGGGAKHRREIKSGVIYGWLLKNNFPVGFRVLCCNCNSSHGRYGYCPHEREI